jgi:hypothetical protein
VERFRSGPGVALVLEKGRELALVQRVKLIIVLKWGKVFVEWSESKGARNVVGVGVGFGAGVEGGAGVFAGMKV